MKKRFRYPERFNTRREYLWYIRGMMDARMSIVAMMDAGIERYRNGLMFTKFANEKPITAKNTKKDS